MTNCDLREREQTCFLRIQQRAIEHIAQLSLLGSYPNSFAIDWPLSVM